ncbi:hypothetical protein BGHDH14_bgh01523 [Blumeria hordei DH14]|uniref:Uncharacterized protein n=1 Tax=Blumeria graminis f. sp. hordei (strain DH14) TaxID=546991 RepID=N1JF65_BLUG1|nr:hypothetical protein BGHDH14_bgh01523 [Blumeria hordei DH14]
MPSAFHTFKLIPMAQASDDSQQAAATPTPSTPQKPPRQSQPPRYLTLHHTEVSSSSTTPTNFTPSDPRMNPPPLPRTLITPSREIRESSVVSSGGSARKPRQNLDERDHLLMLKHCCEQREQYKDGTKAQFWTGVGNAFQRDTGKVLAQMSATVGRLVESRRRQIADWEAGILSQKPGGELNDLLDQWMEFLRAEDGEAEAERMRQVDSRRKVEEARKEARRQAIAAESLAASMAAANPPEPYEPQESTESSAPQHQTTPGSRPFNGSLPPTPDAQQFSHSSQQQQCADLVIMNGHQDPPDLNDHRSQKRKRDGEQQDRPCDFKEKLEQQREHWHAQQRLAQRHASIAHRHNPHAYSLQIPPESPRRVVVEGQLTKDDWRDLMGNDARLRALEVKLGRIETLVAQNNKLLLQLVQSRIKDKDSSSDEPLTHQIDADFDQDYM